MKSMIKEKNISKFAILLPLVFVTIFAIIASILFYQNQNDLLQEELEYIKNSEIISHKNIVKTKVNEVISDIDLLHKKGVPKEEIVKSLTEKEFINDSKDPSTDYFFIYKIDNLQTDSAIKKIFNPNSDDKYLDENKNKFLKIVLKNLRANKETFSEIYHFKKPGTDSLQPKISFFKYYENLNWIVGQGVYLDDIDIKLQDRETFIKNAFKEQGEKFLFLLFVALVLMTLFAVLFSKKIKSIFIRYREEIERKNRELTEINSKLEDEVKEKTKQLLLASRSTAMSDIVTMLAHQWRQPLSVISLQLSNLEDELIDTETMTEYLEESINKTLSKTNELSQTINTFTTLFNNDTIKKEKNPKELIQECIKIISSSNEEIEFQLNGFSEKVNIYPNEFQQILITILRNAYEAIERNSTKNPLIKIDISMKDSILIVEVVDNGGGIEDEFIDKVFEPYSSVKGKNGFGLGLYISNELINNHMKGSIEINNFEDGVKVILQIPID